MSKIGELELVTNDGKREHVGWIKTLGLDLEFKLIEDRDRRSQDAPSHRIVTRGRSGSGVQIGSAWFRLPKAQGGLGEEFFSLTFDDPSFEKPLNVAAFSRDGTVYDIVWRRRQVKAA